MNNWKELLMGAVSPLSGGVGGLAVGGWKLPDKPEQRPARTAAVLVGILDQAEPQVVFTVRARHLRNHPGQVSFPGGSADQDDPSGVSTALREAEEEIGIRRSLVQPVGFLDRIDTVSDFRVLPVVGLIDSRANYVPDGIEVEEVFTVPFAHALDTENYKRSIIERDNTRHLIYSLDWESHKIWGVTAAILMNLAERAGRAGRVFDNEGETDAFES